MYLFRLHAVHAARNCGLQSQGEQEVYMYPCSARLCVLVMTKQSDCARRQVHALSGSKDAKAAKFLTSTEHSAKICKATQQGLHTSIAAQANSLHNEYQWGHIWTTLCISGLVV